MLSGSVARAVVVTATALGMASAFNLPLKASFGRGNRMVLSNRGASMIAGARRSAPKFAKNSKRALMLNMAATQAAPTDTTDFEAEYNKTGIALLCTLVSSAMGLFFSLISRPFKIMWGAFSRFFGQGTAPSSSSSAKPMADSAVDEVLARVASMQSSKGESSQPAPAAGSPKISYNLMGAGTERRPSASGYYMMAGLDASPAGSPAGSRRNSIDLYAAPAAVPPPAVEAQAPPPPPIELQAEEAFSVSGSHSSESSELSYEAAGELEAAAQIQSREPVSAVPSSAAATAEDDVAAVLAATQRMMEERAADFAALPPRSPAVTQYGPAKSW